MRLIDAEEFKKQVAAMCIKNKGDADRAIALIKWIDLQPTAYDVDKVVERLEDARSFREEDTVGYCQYTLTKAIKIVKAGETDD